MPFNLVTYLQSCSDIIAANADFVQLIYYSHIPISLMAFLLGSFVFYRDRKALSHRALFSLAIFFTLWCLLDLIAWISTDSRWIMFSWSLLAMVNSLIFFCSFYFVKVSVTGQDIPWKQKLVLAFLFLPLFILTPTQWNLAAFHLDACEAVEGIVFTQYYYALDLLLFIWLLGAAVRGYRQASQQLRPQILLVTAGITCFLMSFFVTGYLASLLGKFDLVVYGLFGMGVLLAFLVYVIVRYRAFNIKVLGAEVMVTALTLLVASQLFYVQGPFDFILSQVTLLIVILAGYILVRSVRVDVARKEELQHMADQLAGANQELRRLDIAKSEFLSIASHQLRTPLTAIKGFVSLILEGSYGKIPASVQEVLNKIYISNERLIHLVEDMLNISRIESGRMEFKVAPAHIEGIVKEVYHSFTILAKAKKLQFTLQLPTVALPPVSVDEDKIREVIANLVDNAIKYTDTGRVDFVAEMSPDNQHVRVRVTDTGIGIPAAELPNLFKKFSRGKDINRLHAGGSGLGLYIGKQMVEAQGGQVMVTSPGIGQGSTFTVDLTVAR